MAIDPVTISLLALQGATGLGKTIYGATQRAAGRKGLEDAYVAPTGRPKEYAEMLSQARESAVRQRQLDEINKSMATSTEALQRAGSRGVIGGIGAVTEAGIKGRTGVLGQEQADIMRALEFGIQGAEKERTRNIARETRDRAEATAAISAGTQNIVGGLSDIAKTAVVTMDTMEDIDNSGGGSDKGFVFDVDRKAAKNAMGIMGGQSRSVPEFNEDLYKTNEDYAEWWDEYGKGWKEHGGIQKTPGEFSHKTNPIDIMKDGAKIGEMTGGEYIFNPSQAQKLKQLASSGNSKLHKFVSSLLNKPQFK